MSSSPGLRRHSSLSQPRGHSPDSLQREVRDAYAASLKTVFIVAARLTFTAYPVRPAFCFVSSFCSHFVSLHKNKIDIDVIYTLRTIHEYRRN